MTRTCVITVAGAESSGKSTLAQWLAKVLQGTFVPEYARTYLTEIDRPYHPEDLQLISKRQYEILDEKIPGRSGPGSFEKTELFHTIGSCLLQYDPDADLLQNVTSDSAPVDYYIIDGGIINLKLWAAIKYDQQIAIVESAWKDDITDLYILCRPGTQWTADPLREAPGLLERAWIYNQYLHTLKKGEKDFIIFDPLSSSIHG